MEIDIEYDNNQSENGMYADYTYDYVKKLLLNMELIAASFNKIQQEEMH